MPGLRRGAPGDDLPDVGPDIWRRIKEATPVSPQCATDQAAFRSVMIPLARGATDGSAKRLLSRTNLRSVRNAASQRRTFVKFFICIMNPYRCLGPGYERPRTGEDEALTLGPAQRIIDVLDRKLEPKCASFKTNLTNLVAGFGVSRHHNHQPYPKVEPKFRANDPSETWSGHNKTPRWMSRNDCRRKKHRRLQDQ